MRRLVLLALSIWPVLPGHAPAEPPAAPPFAALQRLIRPQPDESKWARVAWLTNLQEARRRAVAQDRPLFLWRSGGGDVLGRT
jgi:hypothetical protein